MSVVRCWCMQYAKEGLRNTQRRLLPVRVGQALPSASQTEATNQAVRGGRHTNCAGNLGGWLEDRGPVGYTEQGSVTYKHICFEEDKNGIKKKISPSS